MEEPKDFLKCCALFENNGFKRNKDCEEPEEVERVYDYSNILSVVINYKQVTFFDDRGDFASVSVNYYELLGYLIDVHIIGIG